MGSKTVSSVLLLACSFLASCAVNPATGEHYWRYYYSRRVERYDPVSGTWTALPLIPASYVQAASPIEYFPELGGLVFVDKPSGVHSVPGRGPDKQDSIATRVRTAFPEADGPMGIFATVAS